MNIRPSFVRTGAVALFGVAASVAAHAAPTYSVSTLAGLTPTVFDSYTATGNAGVATTSEYGVHSTPAGVTAGGDYFFTSPSDGQITVNLSNTSSFSFLWGSPDGGNSITYHTSLGDFSYTGYDLNTDFGIGITGDSSVSTVFTATLAGGTINSVTFTSSNVSFEIDGVTNDVPEPGSAALAALALGALAWTGRRRKA